MEFSYGPGTFIEGDVKIDGEIILSEHKLYLRAAEGDLTRTYLPLEKIEVMRQNPSGVEFFVRPTTTFYYTATIQGAKKKMTELANDIAKRRGLKKKFLKKEWVETPS